MTLLTSMIERPLDPGYAAAAERRDRAGLPRATSLRSPRLILAALLVGLLVGIAAVQLLGSETTKQRTKASLIERIEQQQEVVDARATEAGALRSEIAALDAETLREVGEGRRLVAVLSILDDKDAAAMLTELLPLCAQGIATANANPRTLPPATLQSLAAQLGYPLLRVEPDPRRALGVARELAGPDGMVLATGSLYLLADLKRPVGAGPGSTL